jgi:hypothetical protein
MLGARRGGDTPPPSPEDAAAITAAITAYLATESGPSALPTVNRWRLAGRLEAHSLPITPTTLTGRWRS